MIGKSHVATSLDAARRFKYLRLRDFSGHANDFGHEFFTFMFDITDFVLPDRPFSFDADEVADNPDYSARSSTLHCITASRIGFEASRRIPSTSASRCALPFSGLSKCQRWRRLRFRKYSRI